MDEEDEEERLLQRQFRCEQHTRHGPRLAAMEDAEGDADEVDDEQQRHRRDEHDRGPSRVAPEHEAPPPVDEEHAAEQRHQEQQVDGRHAAAPGGPAASGGVSGDAERSPRSRLSTSSALIRHIGTPMPGIVLDPA